MKKLIIVFLTVMLVASACTARNDNKNHTEPTLDEAKVEYLSIFADWPVYENAEELTNAGAVIVLGKVKSVSFQVLDIATSLPPTKESETDRCCLHTIYTIDVLTSYKGNTSEQIQICTMGGMKDIYLSEQMQALGENALEGIPVMDEMPVLNQGQSYLFVLHQYANLMPTPINPSQGIYSTDDPLDEEQHAFVSLKDVISAFGEDKWNAFVDGEFSNK